jgi:hypothetical protein
MIGGWFILAGAVILAALAILGAGGAGELPRLIPLC